MDVATNRLLIRLQRLGVKADRVLTPLSFKILCKKAMAACIANPLWIIVNLSAPELIKFLHEEEDAYASLGVYWLKFLPKLLHELQAVLDSLSDRGGILDTHIRDELNQDGQVNDMLEKVKRRLADYFPVLVDESPRISNVLGQLKTVVDVMLILCSEFMDSREVFVVFDDASRRLLEQGFTQRQLDLLSEAGRLPMKQNVDEKETVVGFEEETIKLLERLTGFSKKLEVIPIVGMAGLGKTTLAKRLYHDPYVVYFFDIRSWSSVSQEYVKRDVLLGVLSSIIELKSSRIYSMSDEQLGERIYRGLKGQKYLVVLDDVWDNNAWKELRVYFPDDRNGSRILLTSRNIDLSFEATTHRLRLRTARESWRMLQTMVFENGRCPWRLYDVGKQISAKCYGLPLAVSITAGLLRSRWTRASWKEVAESLSNYIVRDPDQYMGTLALSYNHLPSHLRPCFLYLGVFPGDCDIPVHKLIRLWVAMGFVDETGSKSLEDVAEDYLMDLLGRSLVTVSERGDDGEIKACHVHDLLLSLCMWKANEEGFSPISCRYGRVSSSISPVLDAQIRTNPLLGTSSEHFAQHVGTSSVYSTQHVGTYSEHFTQYVGTSSEHSTQHVGTSSEHFTQHVGPSSEHSTQHIGTSSEHSTQHIGTSSEHLTQHVNFVLCCPIELGECFQERKPFDHDTYKYLRILDMESIFISSFPTEIPNLINLRYLAINSEDGNPPTSISKLAHLQTLIISSTTNIILPRTTWDIKYLRHLYIKSAQTLIEDASNLIGMLSNLQTMSGVCPSASCLSILTRTPNLRKISFRGPLISSLGVLEFPNIRSLSRLQTLKLSNTTKYYAPVKSCSPLMFPERLTRLTLSETCLQWNEIQTFALLPNLEVFKLNANACIGEIWEASDVEFASLKFLILQDLDIVKWEASSRPFPRLQRLVVRRCSRLQEIPCDIGEILTLELIEVSWCGESTARSATMIQKEQERNGNDFLKVLTCVHRDLFGKRKRPSYD